VSGVSADPCPPYTTGAADPLAAAKYCHVCPGGTVVKNGQQGLASTVRAAACSACDPGTIRPQSLLSQHCVECPAGQYTVDSQRCTVCPPGYRTNVNTPGASFCLPCKPGEQPNPDQTDCETCTGAKFSTGTFCKDCNTPFSVNMNHTLCVPPYRCSDATMICSSISDCNAHRCHHCPPSSVAIADGSIQRCVCKPQIGEVFIPGQAACDCKPGFYSPHGNSTCVSCTAGEFALMDQGALVCPGGPRSLAKIYPGPGWWMSSIKPVTSERFLPCVPPEVCLGYNLSEANISNACATEHCCRKHQTGPLCSR
jgi:hypothetical protein